jgi:hypothetical protein
MFDHHLHPFGICRHAAAKQMLFLSYELLRELDS